MKTLGIQFELFQLEQLRHIARLERRSVGFVVRDAVDFYLQHLRLAKSNPSEARSAPPTGDAEGKAAVEARVMEQLAPAPAKENA